MEKVKKILKIVAIVIAVAGAIAGIAFAVKKILDKKKAAADEPENYVSCSCCDAAPVAEVVAEPVAEPVAEAVAEEAEAPAAE